MLVELWIFSEDCKCVKAGTAFCTFTQPYKSPFRGCSQNNNDSNNKREKNSKNNVKLPIVHETVTAVSHLELLRACRQDLRATLEEPIRTGDTKPEYGPGCRGPATSNGGGEGLCWWASNGCEPSGGAVSVMGKRASSIFLICPGMTVFPLYVPSVFHLHKGWLICLYTHEFIAQKSYPNNQKFSETAAEIATLDLPK